MNILIAEDTEDSRIILKKILESAGFNVSEAVNGAEALQMANESVPDMIISDILMPEMDGFELCRKIKGNAKLRRIPFIFYTATYTDSKDERLAMSLGASRFILKPTEADEFLGILKEVIREYEENNLHVPRMSLEDDEALHIMHDDSLTRKLDKKLKDLEKAHNELLEKDKKLQESEKRYRTLMETANDAIFIAEADTGVIINANKSAEKMLCLPLEKIIGINQLHLHPPEDAERYKTIFRNHIENGEAIEGDVEVVNKLGDRIPVEISASVVDDGGKKIIQGIFRDVTQRKNAEVERDHLYSEMSRINEELKQILYVTSHDLRSPLVNVHGYSKELEYSMNEVNDLLKGVDLPSDVRRKISAIMENDISEAVHFIHTSIEKMNSLISGLLNLSRLGRSELSIEEIDMNGFLRDIITTLEFQIKEAGGRVDISDLPACMADRSMLNHIFTNLVDNALKYRSPDRSILIRISGNRKEGQSVYCVEDNGIGISPDYQEKIFELFHQLDPAKSPGEGMGLSIVRLSAEKHHGSVWVESELGKGSKFYVSLPST